MQAYDPYAPVPFNLSRDYILSQSTPPINPADARSASTTRSTYRLHWSGIELWDDFGNSVSNYWNNVVSQADKQRLVLDRGVYSNAVQTLATDMRVTNEGNVKVCLDTFPVLVHSAAANGLNGATRPTDRHSKLQRWEQGIAGSSLAGVPDFVMATEYGNPPRRVTVMMEVKNPWQVTPALIDAVIANQVPLAGNHPGRLAVEQLYGYMVRNGKVYGVLTTMKGWCFLGRVNGGGLYITRMFGDFPARPGVSPGAPAEGYYVTPNFTIMQALYYMSYLAEATNDLPESPVNGVAGQVYLPPAAGGSAAAAPTIRQPHPAIAPMPAGQGGGYGYGYFGQGGYQGVQVLGGYDQADCFQHDRGIEYSSLQFEPWNQENCLGPKTWIARAPLDGNKVVLKLWDAWKFDKTPRDHEVAIYGRLQSLWGIYIPSLRVSTPIDYFHALILQYVNGSAVSASNLTAKAEGEILKAFDAIHALGVVHGDIRADNILVAEKGNAAWVIDFEFAEIVGEREGAKHSCLSQEMDEVKHLLMGIRNHHNSRPWLRDSVVSEGRQK